MYDKAKYMGRTLKEWQEAFANMFNLGELYQMMLSHVNFENILRGNER